MTCLILFLLFFFLYKSTNISLISEIFILKIQFTIYKSVVS